MRATLAITRKELVIYFTTPLAYVMMAMLTFISSWVFLGRVSVFQSITLQYMTANQPDLLDRLNLTDVVMVPLVGSIGTILLFVVPFLTMRLIAEERSRGTFDLLFTAPIRPVQIVLGKYLAAEILLGLALLILLAYPAMLHSIGTGDDGPIEWPTVLSGYLGLFLMGSGLMAVGLFFSAITRSQSVAALVTLVFSLLMFLITTNAQSLEGTAFEVFTYLSAAAHLHRFAVGLLELQSVAYFCSYIVLGLFLCHRALEGQRWTQ